MEENIYFRIPFVILLFLGFSRISMAQMVSPAHVPEPHVTAISERPTNISCESFGQPLSLCIWEKYGSDNTKPSTLISYMQGGQNTTSLPGYYLYGDLKAGVCGLHAENISSTDMAKWQCTLFSETIVYRGIVDVNVVRKPAPPKFIPEELGNLVDGETFGVSGTALSCYSAYGLPPPTFRWYLDDEPYEGNLFPPNTTMDADGNTYTFQQLRNEHFTWRENGKTLRCVVLHEMLTEDDVREASLKINVQFKPRAEQNSISAYVPEVGHPMTTLAYVFYGNPKPRIYWEVDGVRISAGFFSPDRRTEAGVLEQSGPSTWKAFIKIRDLKRSDVKKKYVLKTENGIGRQDFEICITQNPSREGVTCASNALFLQIRPPKPPGSGDAEPDNDDDETRSDHMKNSAENRHANAAILDKLSHLHFQMQLLRDQEARLHLQLQRMKGAKSVEEGSGETESTADDNLTTTIRSESGDFSTEKTRSSREFRFQRVRTLGSNPVDDSPISRARETTGDLELSEVKVESPGLYIRRKIVA